MKGGWVSKNLVCPLKPREAKFFDRISCEEGWDISGVPEKFENKRFVFNFVAPGKP